MFVEINSCEKVKLDLGMVAFFDKKKEIKVLNEDNVWGTKEIEELYIIIEPKEDKYTKVVRKAGMKNVPGIGEVCETKFYKKAYDKYLDIKNGTNYDDKDLEIKTLREKLDKQNKEKKKVVNKVATALEITEAETENGTNTSRTRN